MSCYINCHEELKADEGHMSRKNIGMGKLREPY